MSKSNVQVRITLHSLYLRKMDKPEEWGCACGVVYGVHPDGEPDWIRGHVPDFVRVAHKAHLAEAF